MKIDPRHLEILAAIVDNGGLTEGAEALGKSQPSISRTLSQLESRIGAPLFHPGRRPLKATELGLSLAAQGRSVLEATRVAGQIVDRYRTGHTGLVRVAGTPVFMDGVVAGIIARFQQHMPDVLVEQSYGYADALIDRLRNATLDLAIIPLQQGQVPDDLRFQPILPGLNVIACRNGHPLLRRKSITLSDISQYSWIAPPTNSPLYRDLQRALAKIGAKDFRINFSGGSLASVVSILAGSDSLTVLPYSVVFEMKNQNQISALTLEIGHPDRMLGVLSKETPDKNPAGERFKSFVISQFESLSRRINQHRQEQLWR
ncbi:MAG: LysR family transcriptional regulator [Paracoccaceae bacterium]|nr:LysR family transcriptional regulator [Paracoccaceae bacterium]